VSTYRMLSDHWIEDQIFSAGSTYTTADITSGTPPQLPVGWTPSNNVDPMDTAAVTAFHSEGPSQPSLIRGTFTIVAPPTTYWYPTFPSGGGPVEWKLSGLGANLAAIYE
jgi:hypothetical protein